jgi:transcriptional regulator with XRE-family HTH domain
MNIKEQFGERLKTALEHLGVESTGAARKRYLSKRLDITERQAGNYLNGVKMPTLEGVIDLANKLGVNPNWLLAGIGPMIPLTQEEITHIINLRTLDVGDQQRLYHICESFQHYHIDNP